MAYQVLARKWRPKTFADLVGQEHIVKALRNALAEGRLHHAYLLTGTRGVGKTTIARILAKSLNCEQADHGEPCGVCQSCTQIDAGRYVDLLEIDAASNTGIDNIREVLENAQYAPTAGKYKVYIIDEVHMLSKSAFNAMLKTLEEPPEHVKFILATTDPHKVPITVLSRCLQFVLRNMTTQQVADHLAHVLDSEGVPYEAPALQLLGRAAAGSMRDALSLLDQAIAMGSGQVAEQDVRQMIGAVDKRYLYELLQSVVNQDGKALLDKAQEMAASAIGFDSALGELAMLLQRLALIQAVPSAVGHDDPEREVLLQLSQSMNGEQIQLYYQCAVHGKRDLSLAPDEYAGFVMTLLRMLAFAPLAAQDYAPNGVIEHTQLKDRVPDGAAKKISAEPMPSENPTVQTASHAAVQPAHMLSESHAEQTDDTPPRENGAADTADIQTASNAGNGFSQTAEMETPPQNSGTDDRSANSIQTAEISEDMPSENPTAGQTDAHTAVRPLPAQPDTGAKQTDDMSAQGVNVAAADIQTASNAGGERFQTAAMKTPQQNSGTDDGAANNIQTDATPEDMPSENRFDDLPPYFAPEYPETHPNDDGYAAPLPDSTPAVPQDDETEEEDEPQFAALPDFKPENWAELVRRFAKKLGASQMLAQHAAWTRYEADAHLLMLSLTAEAKATANKERLDKIRDTLSAAYGLPLKLQTEPWRDDMGWETPTMLRKRLQLEGRRQAQALLEADTTAQQIMQAFGAEWLPETLELKQP